MNYVIGRLSDHKQGGDWGKVREIQVAVAKADSRGSWVDTDDLNNKPKKGQEGTYRNDLHYTKAGYRLMARRFARQAVALIQGKKPAKNGRPGS